MKKHSSVVFGVCTHVSVSEIRSVHTHDVGFCECDCLRGGLFRWRPLAVSDAVAPGAKKKKRFGVPPRLVGVARLPWQGEPHLAATPRLTLSENVTSYAAARAKAFN